MHWESVGLLYLCQSRVLLICTAWSPFLFCRKMSVGSTTNFTFRSDWYRLAQLQCYTRTCKYVERDYVTSSYRLISNRVLAITVYILPSTPNYPPAHARTHSHTEFTWYQRIGLYCAYNRLQLLKHCHTYQQPISCCFHTMS